MKKHRRLPALLLAILLLAGCGQVDSGAESPSQGAAERSPAVTAGPSQSAEPPESVEPSPAGPPAE